MSAPPRAALCRNCQRSRPDGELDARGWCGACRREVIRRSSLIAGAAALLGALALTSILFVAVDASPRFLIGWLVLAAAVFFFLFKLVRRVAFEAIRARGVPPPEN